MENNIFNIKAAEYDLWKKTTSSPAALTANTLQMAIDIVMYGSIHDAIIARLAGSTLRELYIEEMNGK